MAVRGMLARALAGRNLPDDGSSSLRPGERLPVCPGCGGSLAPRQRRCPACGSRMVAGVLLHKAAALTGMGVVAGVVVASVVAGSLLPFHWGVAAAGGPADSSSAAAAGTNATALSQAATASASPVSSTTHGSPVAGTATQNASPATSSPSLPAASAAPAGPTALAGLPVQVASTLRTLAVTNDRLVAAGRDLSSLVRSGAYAPDLAGTLRRIAADASAATQLLPGLRTWTGGARLVTDLGSFYTRLGRAASGSASLANNAAYLDVARSAMNVLGDLPALAKRTRTALDSAASANP